MPCAPASGISQAQLAYAANSTLANFREISGNRYPMIKLLDLE